MIYILLHETHDGNNFLGAAVSEETIRYLAEQYFDQKVEEYLAGIDDYSLLTDAQAWVSYHYSPVAFIKLYEGLWKSEKPTYIRPSWEPPKPPKEPKKPAPELL